ncbi:hypothetical protein DXM21_12645 [Agrobacterium rosae]|nr:hypothetical protein DXM21_12645 [Agrobacterium rosae]KAA3520186.1 hypothetical protein DXM25_10970 [Agrobacterium rosae]MQB48991.1 hypothetical protein [Agrobacterium rosae]
MLTDKVHLREKISPSFLCLSQESSRRASARQRESFQPKDLGWLNSCDKHRNEGDNKRSRADRADAITLP